MYSFNNDNIITGYIKELLHSFNLPSCRVFNNENEFKDYFKDYLGKDVNGFGIIKNYDSNNSYIVYKDDSGNIKKASLYSFNHYYKNLTKNMSLYNSIYDSECHKYLGDYLRFIRDYKGINLMSMYNCFDNELFIDNKYKYIIIPVKYNTNYTIAFDCKNYSYILTYSNNLESIQNDFKESSIEKTYITSYFLKPFVIKTDKGKDEELSLNKYKKAAYRENEYNLVIRTKLNSSNLITVLEGDYTKSKKYFYPIQANYDKKLDDKSYSKVDINNLVTNNIQLLNPSLKIKNKSYPFADRLIEYLTDMCIIPGDRISKNIIEAKYKVYERYGSNGDIKQNRSTLGVLNDSFTNIDRLRFLDAFSQSKLYYKNTFDLLGYVDKEIEECLDDDSRLEGGTE
jgi:hypothetical protein